VKGLGKQGGTAALGKANALMKTPTGTKGKMTVMDWTDFNVGKGKTGKLNLKTWKVTRGSTRKMKVSYRGKKRERSGNEPSAEAYLRPEDEGRNLRKENVPKSLIRKKGKTSPNFRKWRVELNCSHKFFLAGE